MSNPDLSGDEAFQALREALRASPNNIALREHLGDLLLSHGRPEEAEKEYREALGLAPNRQSLKMGLAQAFYRQGKNSHALVIVEDMVKSPKAPARALILHAKLLAGIGEVEKAVSEYRRGVELDESVADLEFASRLGIGAVESESESEVVEGKVRASWNDEREAGVREVERPKIGFADVGGMEKVKEEIRLKIIHPLA